MKYVIGSLVIAVLVVLSVIEEQFTHREALIFEEKRIGELEISLSLADLFKDRIDSRLLVEFDDLPGFIDGKISESGNMGSCAMRLYWVGDTKVKNGGVHLDLSSRVRFESWTCINLVFDELKTRNFRDTKTLWWHLFISWQDNPAVVAKVDNIKNFPDFLERRLDLRIRKVVPIPIPEQCGRCDCKETFKPALERSVFMVKGQDVSMRAKVSLENIGIVETVKCFMPGDWF